MSVQTIDPLADRILKVYPHLGRPQPVSDTKPMVIPAAGNINVASAIRAARTNKIIAIQILVAGWYRMSVDDLTCHRRFSRLVKPRQVAMYLCRDLLDRSFPEIGRRFGGRDHTTIMYGVRRIQAATKVDADLAYDVAHLERAAVAVLGAEQ